MFVFDKGNEVLRIATGYDEHRFLQFPDTWGTPWKKAHYSLAVPRHEPPDCFA
jgi:hypothetical protein